MNITGEFVAFFVLSVFAIGGAVFMINFTKVVHMVISMAATMLSVAGIFFMLNAEFVAVVQVLIYSGAVTILMLFGIMLTRHTGEETPTRRPLHRGLSFVAVAVLFAFLMWGINTTPFPGEAADVSTFTVENIGLTVFKQFVIPFELLSVLLLVALVGAIILAKKEAE